MGCLRRRGGPISQHAQSIKGYYWREVQRHSWSYQSDQVRVLLPVFHICLILNMEMCGSIYFSQKYIKKSLTILKGGFNS